MWNNFKSYFENLGGRLSPMPRPVNQLIFIIQVVYAIILKKLLWESQKCWKERLYANQSHVTNQNCDIQIRESAAMEKFLAEKVEINAVVESLFSDRGFLKNLN